MALGAADQGRVDQHPVGAVLAHEELVVVGAQGPLLKEEAGSRLLNMAGGGDVAGELLDALQEGVAARQGVDDSAGAVVLGLEEGQPVLVLVVLHPAIGIADGLPEIGVGHYLDPGDGRRRHDRAPGRGDGGRAEQ